MLLNIWANKRSLNVRSKAKSGVLCAVVLALAVGAPSAAAYPQTANNNYVVTDSSGKTCNIILKMDAGAVAKVGSVTASSKISCDTSMTKLSTNLTMHGSVYVDVLETTSTPRSTTWCSNCSSVTTSGNLYAAAPGDYWTVYYAHLYVPSPRVWTSYPSQCSPSGTHLTCKFQQTVTRPVA